MMTPRRTYVNLKYLSEFNKYMMALGAAAFLYFDKFEAGFRTLRTGGAILSTLAVVIGVLIMSVLGRIHGDDIDYEHETDQNRILLFRIISRALSIQLAVLVITIMAAGWLSLAKIWKW